jgi:hypothetical protein
MAYTQNTGVPKKRSVFLRVWEADEYEPESDGRTHYYAKVGRTLDIEGWVYYGDRGDIKNLVRRVLKAEAPLPEKVAKAVDSMAGYLAMMVTQLGSTTAAASAGFDYNESEGLSFTVEMFYGDDGRWAVEVRAVNVRHNGRHILTKRTALSQVTTEALRKIIERVVRQAYNAYL